MTNTSGPTLQPVQSSNIAAVGFDANTGIRVQFKGGRTYDHPGSTQDEYGQFLKAPSMGKWYITNLKGRHREVK